MLIQLEINDFAIIDNTKIDFKEKLNVLSGETGAGKSIILAAIDIITGGKIKKSEIRTGSEKAIIRAVFLKNEMIKKKLEALNLDTEDDYVTLERVFNTKGRSTIRINESIQTNQNLKKVANDLVDICGQRDAQKLFKEETYIEILNERIEEEILNGYRNVYGEYKEVKTKLEELKNQDRTQEQFADLYRMQIKEIKEAELNEEEEEELENKKVFLDNFEKISQATNTVIQVLENNDAIYTAMKELEMISEKVPELKEASEMLSNSYYELDSVKDNVQSYVDGIEFDEFELNRTIERLEEIKKLKKKYGDNVREILNYCEEIEGKLKGIENRDEDIEYMEKRMEEIEKKIKQSATLLSQKRKEVAIEVGERLENELKELCIEDAEIQFDVVDIEEYNKHGNNKIDLLFSANKGQEKQPLAKVASGGEVSRVLLALKLMSDKKDNQTMIFDEVDVGVGGEVGRIIGEKLKKLGETTQVLCISHLPQVAAKGSHHFQIKKMTEGEMTVSRVSELSREERINEIARMIYGDERTEITLKQAEEMLS